MPTNPGCTQWRAIERAFPETNGSDLRAHLATCRDCARRLSELQRLADLGRALATPELSSPSRAALRESLLLHAATRPRRSAPRRWLTLGMAAALLVTASVALVVALGTRSDVASEARSYKGDVHPHPGAHFVRIGALPDEVVRLVDGTLTVEVNPLEPGERFRVVVGDAEIEVRGTAFDVVCEHDALVSVYVLHGHVEVRPQGQSGRLLGPGERWTRPAPIDAAHVAPAAPVSAKSLAMDAPQRDVVTPDNALTPTALPASPPHDKPRARTQHVAPPLHPPATAADSAPSPAHPSEHAPVPAEALYQAGWEALRAGRTHEAAEAFASSLAAGPVASLAEDASFWHAVALGRTPGQQAEAVMAFRAFIDRYSNAVRVREASAILGWLLLDQLSFEEAQRRFQAASTAGDARVQDSAKRGLVELERRRAAIGQPER